jgi:hypothetical protein
VIGTERVGDRHRGVVIGTKVVSRFRRDGDRHRRMGVVIGTEEIK